MEGRLRLEGTDEFEIPEKGMAVSVLQSGEDVTLAQLY